MKPKILVIAGPTAVGKTSFSIECAKMFNGEIISADSIQIYKGLNIGSAKATKEERQQAIHHLIDFVEPNSEFSASEFSKLAKQKIDEILSRNKLPIVVGGTGLFVRSLLYPFSFGNTDKDEKIRQKWEDFLLNNSKEELWEELNKVDPESALKIDKSNTRRVIRAIEIFELTNTKKSEQNDLEKESPYDYLLIFLSKDREILYQDINTRVDKMMQLGLLEEVKNLIKDYNLTRQSQSMQAIGYKEFFDYFENKKSLEEVVDEIKKASRHYAKRQFTWYRHTDNVNMVDYLSEEKFLIVKNWINS